MFLVFFLKSYKALAPPEAILSFNQFTTNRRLIIAPLKIREIKLPTECLALSFAPDLVLFPLSLSLIDMEIKHRFR